MFGRATRFSMRSYRPRKSHRKSKCGFCSSGAKNSSFFSMAFGPGPGAAVTVGEGAGGGVGVAAGCADAAAARKRHVSGAAPSGGGRRHRGQGFIKIVDGLVSIRRVLLHATQDDNGDPGVDLR